MRNGVIIAGICIVLIAVGGWLYIHRGRSTTRTTLQSENTASASNAVVETEIAFTKLAAGTDTQAMPVRKNYAIYTSTEFASFWKKANANGPVPKIDFKTSYVIAVFAGEEPTTGYAISVQSVKDSSSVRAVTVRIQEPGNGCTVAATKTSPYEFVSVPLTDIYELTHTDVVVKTDCP